MKKNSRDYIIQKAAPVFNRQGIIGTSIADICKAIGMTKGSIYANFKDKDELALEVFRYNVKMLADKVSDITNLTDNPHEKLMLILDFHENIQKYPEFNFGCPVANMATEADDTNDTLREEVDKVIRLDVAFYISLIEEAINKGIYSREADSSYAYFMFAALEGALLVVKPTGEKRFLSDVCTEIRKRLESWKISPGYAKSS